MINTLSISGLVHQFGGKMILNDVCFDIKPGDILGLFGRNGSGKSTLLNLLFGSLKLQKGEIKINGTSANIDLLRRYIAYSTQRGFLPPSITVRNIIPLYFSDGEDQNKIFYSEGIHKMEKSKVGSLSLGEKKYLQFLMVAHLPQKFILLDEPFAMIDPLYRDLIKTKIIELSQTKGFIITDHYYKDVFDICNRFYLIKNGQLMPVASLPDLQQGGYLSNG